MKYIKWFILCSVLFLVGCWDERLLKEHSLILTISYDQNEKEQLVETVTFPIESEGEGAEVSPTTDTNTVSVTGETVKDADMKIEQYAPEKFDRSKAKVIFIGKKLAEQGMFSTLDSIYRDLRGPLNAQLVVVDGEAKEAQAIEETYQILLSDFYTQLIESAHHVGLVQSENVQSVCPVILTEGKDVALPYIEIEDDGKKAHLNGVALFTNDQLTGHLKSEESALYLVLRDEAPDQTKLNMKIYEDQDEHVKNYVDFAIRHSKRKMNISIDDDKLKVDLQYELNIQIDEFASDHLQSEKKANKLVKKIEADLKEDAEKIIDKMLKANHDGLGIGQQVKAYEHDYWKSVDWMKEYPNIEMNPSFDVKIISHGIMN